ncbi:TAP42-like protein [Trichoderma citrinoviride]|uniref:TAP42-like protein n=1 Tax=Trichoderma citrinoviride TaxID=58853 RepID=A0A2T4BN92_9HYPO|nr:TAP42-like protein [Trichoderma citrinoviride]PTB70794.1 TAP42-like protein [Trichoderma citrinoviride]
MASSDEPQSLRAIFEAAEAKRQEVLDAPIATSPKYAQDLAEALKLYAQARDQIAALSLFSANEGAEDIATSSLPYLLVDFYIAELVQRTPHLAPKERLQVLGQARAAYERFLSMVDGYGLLTPPYDKLLERYRDDEEGFAVVAAGADMAAKREGKIASFKAEKALKEKLQALRRNPRYLEHGDEELVRELHLTNIQFAVHSTFQALDSLNREVPLLRSAPSPSAAPTTGREDPADTSFRLDQPFNGSRPGAGGPLLSTKGKPLQPFTLVGSRADLARGVFRPGHNLPTMSIDEYLEEEKRRGGILEGGGTEPPKKVVDEDDMEAVDRETYKARAWDDFTDDNRKGSGNTLNMG